MEHSPYDTACVHVSWILVLVGSFICLSYSSTEARRIHLTPEQQAQLANANSVLIKVLALTEKGPADSFPFIETITTRLQELNYTVVTDPAQPTDIEFKVNCEERKTLTGTSTTGGDVDLSDAPDRLWKGPACLLTYQLDHRDLDWKKEIRTSFPDADQAAQEANVDSAGQYAMTHLNQRLAEYEFPLLLSAEWGQVDRLLERLEHPKTPKLRKAKILSLLSDLQAQKALPKLTKLLESTDLQEETINALAGAGIDSIPLLIDFFETSKQSTIRAEAAKALGKVAAKSSDPRIIPP
ncbi:MAG: HEAT repeat domain-containing protein, partial [Nitrospirota bacterium]|nr:HEAT repeat domain-containing protein [Nitrospirota bacterium]